jgi:hypothetical protein
VDLQADLMPKRPPFTGIHEILPRRGEGAPNEGGGRIPPFGEDIINKVVDVNFGGGLGAVFVSGDYCCYLRAVGMAEPTLDQPWVGLTSLDFGDGGGNYASTYAVVDNKPTFLMSGYSDGAHYHGDIIMLSHDGVHWQTVLAPRTGIGLYYLVWDPNEQAFYSAPHDVSLGSYRSPTGYEWTFLPGEDFYSHCPNGISDGFVGTDPDTGLTILPQDVPTDIVYANVTAFCGGIWLAGGYRGSALEQAGGYSCTAASIDGGETWHVVTQGKIGMTGDFAILCISGAPWGDFTWNQPEPLPG